MFTLTDEQDYVASEAVKWFLYGNEQVFQYAAPPGAGKSVVLNEIIMRLGLNPLTEVAAMSYIGSASLVMRMKGLLSAKTAHSWIYNIIGVNMIDENGKIMMDPLLNVPIQQQKFIPVDRLPDGIKLIAIDEGYSMPLKMRSTIEKFGIKVIVCGDTEQLGPVNDQPAYLTSGKIYRLTKRLRQQGSEDIAYITKTVNAGLPLLNGYYGNSLVINYNELTDNMLMRADMVICCKNSTRDYLNNRMRACGGYRGPLPHYGEKIVCRKNNWLENVEFTNGTSVSLVNGLTGRVLNNPDASTLENNLFSLSFSPDLCRDALFNTRANYNYMIADYKTRQAIKNNKYEVGNMFEFANAVTCHVAQGSEAKKVVYISEKMRPDMQHRLDNVGASRATSQLIYVKA